MNHHCSQEPATGARRLLRRIRGDILFGPMFFIGILAAIAVPAYQDYTIRSQTTEGLNLASEIKAAVAGSYAETGAWPANLRQLKFERTPRGRYVAFVSLKDGTIVIRYGGRAHAALAGKQVTLRPTLNPKLDVVWSCGYSEDLGTDPAKGGAPAHATSVPAKYLPSACRGSPG